MKSLWKNAKIRTIIALLFFAFAVIYILLTVFHPSPIETSSISGADVAGQFIGYYLVFPAIAIFISWVFIKSGKKKLQKADGKGLATDKK